MNPQTVPCFFAFCIGARKQKDIWSLPRCMTRIGTGLWVGAVLLCFCASRDACAGALLVSGYNSNNVVEFDASSGAYVSNFIPAGSGGLNAPEQLGFAPNGNLLVNSFGSNQVLRFDGTTGSFQSVFATISSPTGMIFRGNDVFISSYSASGFVNRYDATTGNLLGTFVTAGSGGLGLAHGMAFGPNGNLFVSDNNNNRVLQYDGTTGAFINIFATGGGLSLPTAVTFENGDLYVSSNGNNKIAHFNGTTGALVGDFVSANSGGLTEPHGLIFRGDGLLYAAGGTSVLLYDDVTGAYTGQFAASSQLQRATYMTFTSVPEPASLSLLTCGGFCLLARRGRK
jgi:DNA-binding beta-propeller fold protein YncE